MSRRWRWALGVAFGPWLILSVIGMASVIADPHSSGIAWWAMPLAVLYYGWPLLIVLAFFGAVLAMALTVRDRERSEAP